MVYFLPSLNIAYKYLTTSTNSKKVNNVSHFFFKWNDLPIFMYTFTIRYIGTDSLAHWDTKRFPLARHIVNCH